MIMSFKDNFSQYTHVCSKASWPLPPSSVFRLRAARPWIPPEMFGIGTELQDYRNSVVVGQVQEENEYEEILDYEDKWYSIKEEDDSIYAELVEVYGLPLPNSRVQVIQYSDNPEKGIDLGVDEGKSGGGVKKGEGVHKFVSREVVLGGNKRSNYLKKWSPFSKHKDLTKLFY